MASIAIQRTDGGVSIMTLADGADAQTEVTKWAESWGSAPVAWIVINAAPDSRDYRESWVLSNGQIMQDLEKAKEIHRNKLRRDRSPRLADLDSQSIQATENNDNALRNQIRLAKQKLRDAPQDVRITNALTIDALRALTLDFLITDPPNGGQANRVS